MEKQQFSAKSLDAALDEAAKFFATDKVFVRYNILENKSKGFLSKLFSRSISIEAWIETSKQDLQAAAREVVRQTLNKKNDITPQKSQSSAKENNVKKETTNINEKEVREIFENFKNIFLSALHIDEKNVNIITKENELVITVSDPTLENFLSKSDKLSLAFEHILKRMIQKKCGEVSTRFFLTTGKSDERREEHLIEMAKNLAEKVRKTGKSIVISSKSNTERKVIHLALDKATGVATRSIGTGERRKLVIYPLEKRNPGHGKRQQKRKTN